MCHNLGEGSKPLNLFPSVLVPDLSISIFVYVLRSLNIH